MLYILCLQPLPLVECMLDVLLRLEIVPISLFDKLKILEIVLE